MCLSGREKLLAKIRLLGFHRDGVLAEQIFILESSILPVPDGLFFELVCLAEPLACGLNALDRTSLLLDEKVLLKGGGPVDLLLAAGSRQRGAISHVVDISEKRLKCGISFLDTLAIESIPSIPTQRFHIVINTTSAPEVLPSGL